jgi:lipoate synthase
LYQALLSSYKWHQDHYSATAHYLPDFFDVDKKAVSKTKKIVGVGEVAGNIVSVLKDQGYRRIGKRKISLETNSLSLLGFDIKQ